MKKDNIIYWISTGLFAAMMSLSATMYFISPEIKANFDRLGFQDAFRIELGAAKLLGALVLILPFLKGNIKEWAYAGFGITLISAFILHLSVGDTVGNSVAPLVFLGMLVLSHFYYHKRGKQAVVAGK
ncbi:MAG: DoxX-like family protein [Candidatus Fluviicola riflensis]|nr:MAG: DoxX-like family protein [Candidatus Fluviicola riflensis]OGS77188.1 MAG: DoxX-like family protein [Candidatus Fluviicola riflensis]OGS82123.1 MAG: DoxX-like family protein [Fluviicola sp. RIFCSPHIGHO2_01_FULL_43_53]OGS87817.1 MAG: DoxX-like family protein [Fluviicola sp. RIFCSPHIGHO2_12_FULL_43_24]